MVFNVLLCIFLVSYHVNLTFSIGPDSLQLNSSRYNECGRYTCPDNGKFQFAPDTMYTYFYSLVINSTFDKSSEISSELKLELKIDLRIESCEGIMRVQEFNKKVGFEVFDKTESDKIYEDVKRKILRFSFYDGSIINICPSSEESILSLNIKKGILSAFQNKMKRFDIDKFVSEKDVNGICPTYYNLEKINGTKLVIRKLKDISNCLERYQLHSIIPTSRFVFQSKYHKWTPLNVFLVCHQTIDHSIPIQILCTEEHTLKKFNNQTYISKTIITQKFDLIRETQLYQDFFNFLSFPVLDEIENREDLSFNHKKPKKSEISELEESEALLLKLCDITMDNSQSDAASIFTKFIHTARHLAYDALNELLEKSSLLCTTGRKHVLDSLPFLRSTAAISLMNEIIMEHNIPESTANAWLLAMSLFARPDREVISSVIPLFESENASHNVLLRISSIIHSYCVWNSDCDKDELILQTINYIERTLNETIVQNKWDKAIVLLKSLGNAGIESNKISYTLSACIRSSVPMDVRIAAVESHRRLACNFNLEFLLDVYMNEEYESELRIAAYLQVMKCPSYDTIKKVRYMLETEKLNQVGLFVWSHFENIRKSTIKYRIEIQSILQDYHLKKKFKKDFRKFSRNYETSFYTNDYNIGGIFTCDVVFSTKSYIPRYLTFNISVSIFDETVNVLEISIFLEGFEKYAEKFLKNAANLAVDELEKKYMFLRFLRSITNTIQDKIELLPFKIISGFVEPTISFAYKLFGKELKYASYRGENEISTFIENFNFTKILNEFLNGQEFQFDLSTVFMDVSYVSPTGAGIPLNLDAVGISIINFDSAISINATQFETNQELTVNGKLKPSFSINFEGTMGTDMVFEQTQVQLKSKIFTSSEIEGNFHMNGYDDIFFSFHLPQEKFNIFSLETNLFYKDNSIQTDVMVNDKLDLSGDLMCFWPLLDQAVGLKICSSYRVPEANFMLHSFLFMLQNPFKFSLFVEKSDPSAKKYVFTYNKQLTEVNGSMITTKFETPNSKIPRSMNLTYYSISNYNNLNILIHFNQTTVQAKGVYNNTPEYKIVTFDLNINGLKHIELILELNYKQDKRTAVYTPKLFFAINSKPVAEASGSYKWLEKKGVSQGHIDLQFKTNKFDSNITGYVMISDGLISNNIHVAYKFEKSKNESLNFELKYKNKSTKLATVVGGNLLLESTSYPEISSAFRFKYQHSYDHIDAKIEYISNPFEEDERKKLNFQVAIMYLKSFNGLKINTYIEIRKTVSDVDIKVGIQHQNNPASSVTNLLMRYAKDKDIVVRLEIFAPQTVRFQYELKLNTTVPTLKQPLSVHISILEKYEKDYYVDFIGTWFSGHTAIARGMIQDKSSHYVTSYIIKLSVKSRLFTEVLIAARLTYNEYEHKLSITADHNNIKYIGSLKHVLNDIDTHETFVEYIYNNSASYSLNNCLDFQKKEIIVELHLDRYRDVHISAKGMLNKLDSDIGIELKWDVNRDPSQKLIIKFNTKSTEISENTHQYIAKFLFEYPGHISVASLTLQNRDTYHSLSVAFESNPSSVIEVLGYCQNDFFAKGIIQLGFKLITPFENWKESAFSYGLYVDKQNFETNGSLVWLGDQNIQFNSQGGYLFDDDVTSFTLSSVLNSTVQELTAIAFGFNYTSITNKIHLSFLLQPNVKYSLLISATGSVSYIGNATEYQIQLSSKTPFLEYKNSEFNFRTKFMMESKISSDFAVQLNDNIYKLRLKGILNLLDKTKLCVYASTPFEKFQSMNGVVLYDPDEKHMFLNLNNVNFNFKIEMIYVYNSLSNFHVQFQLMTPISYLSNVLLVGMYKQNKALEIRCGWNTFNIGFLGITHYQSYTDLEYKIQLFTPIETFKESSIVLKSLINTDQITMVAKVILSNITKAGIDYKYNSEKGKTVYTNECDNYDSDNMPGMNENIILKNVLFELDTLIYPTIEGKYLLQRSDTRYTIDMKIAVFFFKLNLNNQIDYYDDDNGSFNDTMRFSSSIDMFSYISSNLAVKRYNLSVTNAVADIEFISFKQKLNGSINIRHTYAPILEDGYVTILNSSSRLYGKHNLAVILKTPFDLLKIGEIKADLHVSNFYYETSVNISVDHINTSMFGSVQVSPNFFQLNTLFSVTSSSSTIIPRLKLQILRDFSKVEKQIIFAVGEILHIDERYRDIFSVRSKWYIDNRNYITLVGELKSPLLILDELKASLHYSHELKSETYYLEANMKYSNKTEMKARTILKPPNVTLNLESSMEGLRNAHFVGTLDKISAGHQKIDAVMLGNNNFRIQGWSSVTDLTPFAIKGKLLKGREGVELSSVEMHVKKKSQGYNILASLFSKGKSLIVKTDINDYPNNSRIINLEILTTKGDMERLQVNAMLNLRHPNLYILTIKGDSKVEDNRVNLDSEVQLWFRNGTAAIFANLDSSLVKDDVEILCIWKPPNQIFSSAKINIIIQKQITELLNTKVYFMRSDEHDFNNLTTGILVNFKQKWILEANVTSSLSSENNTKIVSYLILPNKNIYSIVSGLRHSEKFDVIQHVIVYSKNKEKICYTVSDINLGIENLNGFFGFRCGIKDSLYMVDHFIGKKTTNALTVENTLKSNTLTDSLITKLNYEKPYTSHILRVEFYYPPEKLITSANINFESAYNFNSYIQTSTPFPHMRTFACELIAVTNTNFYQRYGKIYLPDKPSFINITHVRMPTPKSTLSDGEITIVFPVTTWHEGVITYFYENILSSTNGSVELKYNGEKIIKGNFTRNVIKHVPFNKELTHMEIGNNFIPIGINYILETNNEQFVSTKVRDSKKIEIYKLRESSVSNITLEAVVENVDIEEWTSFRILQCNRSAVIKSYTDGRNSLENGIFIKLKPEFWFHYNLKTNKTISALRHQKLFDMNIAYPRRNFSLVNELDYGTDNISLKFTVNNYLANPNKAIGLICHTTKVMNNQRNTSVILFHPSFKKNVTLATSIYYSKSTLVDLKIDLEYSNDTDRKFEFYGTIEDKSLKKNRNYNLHITGKHLNTALKLNVLSALKSGNRMHFIEHKVFYKRKIFPEQFWTGKGMLNMLENSIDIEKVSTSSNILIHGDYKNKESNYKLNTIVVQEPNNVNISGYYEADLHYKKIKSIVNFTSDASDRLEIDGAISQNREAKCNIWRTFNDFTFPQVSSYIALNNSQFLSSTLLWRTDITSNILKAVRSTVSYTWTSAQESVEFWTHYLRGEIFESFSGIWDDAKPDLKEFLDDFHNIKTIQDNINYFKTVLNSSYNANEFYLRDIHELYTMLTQEMNFMHKFDSVPKLVIELIESMGETNQVIKNSIIWIVNMINKFYEEAIRILDDLADGKAEVYFAKIIRKTTEKLDIFMKDLHISFISNMETSINEFSHALYHYWDQILTIFEPTFIEILHYIDSAFWTGFRKLLDFVYARKSELMNAPFILRNANFTQKVDTIYKDFTKNDFFMNLKKYLTVIFSAMYEYYFAHIPYRQELASISNEILTEIKVLYKLPLIAYTVDNVELMLEQIQWLYRYLDVPSYIHNIIPFFYKQLYENSITALEVERKTFKPKTKFIFEPYNGIIKIEQKLPFPWHAFNETPVYDEIEEYRYLKKLRNFFPQLKHQIFSVFDSYTTLSHSESWFPPFKGHAHLIGLHNFITFDSVHVPFNGNSCKYLLSHDFFDDEFSLILNSNENNLPNFESISLLSEKESINIEFHPIRVTVESYSASTKFPLQFTNNTCIYFDHGIVTIKNRKGVTIECNAYYSVCTVHLSGWFFGKVSGLLGTMNNEPSDDTIMYDKKKSNRSNVTGANTDMYTWSLSAEEKTCPYSSKLPTPIDYGVNEKCSKLFLNSSSSFEPCFNEVEPLPYYNICIADLEDESVCSVAFTYVRSCTLNGVPLRIPNFCVKCPTGNNQNIVEGMFSHVENKAVPKSSDVVFIVEAKTCFQHLFNTTNIQLLISTLSKEFINNGYINNRYALVTFGGKGIFDKPHSVVVNNNVFSDAANFSQYFEHISIGNGNSDIFAAIRFATKLSLRIAVSKTFILILCSHCEPQNMMLDYSVLHHAMKEKSITLHILMNENFPLDKLGSSKLVYGLDSLAAYTKSDYKHLKGDKELRKQIKLTKSLLGYCTPLALESNGTLFTAKVLSASSNNIVKKFITVFSKRVVTFAKPESCQDCECHSDNNGVPYIECISCSYPMPINFDFVTDEENNDESTSSLIINIDSSSLNSDND